MVVEAKHRICDGHLLKWLAGAGLAWLEHNEDEVNRMNVFPVPDGDTGTNMRLTMEKACAAISQMDEGHIGIVAEAMAQGALMGARGNSGVILSQIWAGFAEEVKGHEIVDAPLFVRACQSAVDAAYNAVIEPVEGTVLTVVREATETMIEQASYDQSLLSLFETLVEAAQTSLRSTPKILPVLKEAGVVDSGGMGLVYILEGMLRLLRGEAVEMKKNKVSTNGQHWQEALVPEDEEGYGYDVQFLMRGADLNVKTIRADIDAMGWSTLVVGDKRLIKVHVHVHDPGEPISYAIGLGASLDDIVVENMQQQYEEYVEERLLRETASPANHIDGVAVITVASGDELRTLFMEDLQAAHVIVGGQTMNPSTEDFLAAIDQLPNDEFILLPNNKNILMAAQQAASLSPDKTIRVIPSRTVQQGISAMFAYMNNYDSGDIERIADAMQNALDDVISAEVTTATRSVLIDGIQVQEGQLIGLLDGKLVVSGDDLNDVVCQLLHEAQADQHELITLYHGSGVSSHQAQNLMDILSQKFDGQEVVVVEGGQPLYPYLISVE